MKAAELRTLYRDETVLHRMTSSAPPVVSEISQTTGRNGRAYYDVTDHMDLPDQIGQNMSAELVSLIGEVRLDWASYGPRHPIRRALVEWERSCRRRHRPDASLRWRDHAGPICGEMLYAVVNGCSVRWCAERWGVPFPRAERLIAAGVRFVAERYARSQDDALGMAHDREACDVCREEGA